jgi:FAD/FMN-containing dehydrogenase
MAPRTERTEVSSDRRAEPTTTVSGWGGMGVPAVERQSEDLESATEDVALTRGLGRSYGDSSLPPAWRAVVANATLADRLLSFDASTGDLRAEAGYTLVDLVRRFLPRGWITPVTPGTQFVTLGGMVAADVHGKNHHVHGTIGRHVQSLRIRVGTGAIVECSPAVHPDLFWATVGGMGLTGHILEVTLRLMRVPSPWIIGTSQQVGDIDAFMDALKRAASEWPYTMGWIDCLSRGRHLGRGVLFCGRWAEPDEAPKHFPRASPPLMVPVTCPSWTMGRLVGRTFNEIYYRAHWRSRVHVIRPEPFFYPLDSIRQWNRLYGSGGFTQYQCVVPDSAPAGTVRALIDRLTRLGGASFLCVIKDCGDEGEGLLSFPCRGTSVALDLPLRADTQRLVDDLNEFVISVGGRIYLAKDALTRAEHFRAMEPRLARFADVRRRWDPDGRIASAQSARLLGDSR